MEAKKVATAGVPVMLLSRPYNLNLEDDPEYSQFFQDEMIMRAKSWEEIAMKIRRGFVFFAE